MAISLFSSSANPGKELGHSGVMRAYSYFALDLGLVVIFTALLSATFRILDRKCLKVKYQKMEEDSKESAEIETIAVM